MSKPKNRTSRKRLQSHFTTIISVSLVLFMLGLLGLILLNAQKISTHVKENIGFSIILQKNCKPVEITQIKKLLDAEAFTKSTQFTHPDSAAVELQEELGEDFLHFLGYNPLLPSIDVKLDARYANQDSLSIIEAELTENPKIKEVFYQKDLVSAVNENIQKISFYFLGFSLLLLIIAVALINSAIRLSIYSNRFLIKTMQLVGARNAFIRRPFIAKSVGNGIISALISISLIVLLLYYLYERIPTLIDVKNLELYGVLFLFLITLGIIISWFSTSLAVRKYLRVDTGTLY